MDAKSPNINLRILLLRFSSFSTFRVSQKCHTDDRAILKMQQVESLVQFHQGRFGFQFSESQHDVKLIIYLFADRRYVYQIEVFGQCLSQKCRLSL